nr:MAG TPA: hypothetical protein [Caudoviricetes sp.]
MPLSKARIGLPPVPEGVQSDLCFVGRRKDKGTCSTLR